MVQLSSYCILFWLAAHFLHGLRNEILIHETIWD
ncbi:hypothetical protein SLEP1_g50860 [Rubroshorea leprosula]|uniref:Uncharacterized protein n=1 Tax=Rubroshorea leprosula TaxID=152421 RepID=A0AAV5M4W0_9ROSI|nr:hypothetical protein SLEP1_g50860 [Rubroshorea leprosula]